jgi:hypothetical protein
MEELHAFINSSVGGGECSAPDFERFASLGRVSCGAGIHSIGQWFATGVPRIFIRNCIQILAHFFFYGASDRFRAMASPNSFLFGGFSWGFKTNSSFTGWGCQPHAQPPNWRTRVSPFIWVITLDLSGMGAPASSKTTAGIALRVIWPRKPRHYVKVEIPSAGY